MLTCMANFTTYICLSMFTEEDGTTIKNGHREEF